DRAHRGGEVGRGEGRPIHGRYCTYARSGNPSGARRGAAGARPARLPVRSALPAAEDQVTDAPRPVPGPELTRRSRRSDVVPRGIVDLDMVRRVEVDGGRVAVTVALTVAGCPLRNEIDSRVRSALRTLDGVTDVDVEFTVMTDEERAALRERLHGDPAATAGSRPA